MLADASKSFIITFYLTSVLIRKYSLHILPKVYQIYKKFNSDYKSVVERCTLVLSVNCYPASNLLYRFSR